MKTYRKKLQISSMELQSKLIYKAEDFKHVVSYSELSSFRQCPLKHELEYKQRWGKPPKPGSPLPRGSAWHLIMETFYREIHLGQLDAEMSLERCVVRAETAAWKKLRKIQKNYESHTLSEDDVPLLEWMLKGYLEYYSKADAQYLLVLDVENKVIVPLDDEIGIKLKMDLVVQDLTDDTLWIVDHKSGASLPTDVDLSLDDQFGLYHSGFKQLGVDIEGTIHNAAITSMTQADRAGKATNRSKPKTLEQRFARTEMGRTDVELESIRRDALSAAQVAYWNEDRTGPKEPFLPLYSSPDPRQCGWKCSFKEAHLSMREGRSLEGAMLDYGFEQYKGRH